MTEETRANLGIAFFALWMIGTMAAVIYWDVNTTQRATNDAPDEHSTLKCVVEPIKANCLPPGPDEAQPLQDDGITPEVPGEPPEEVEVTPGILCDHIPDEYLYH
jgi:hypothetical protein